MKPDTNDLNIHVGLILNIWLQSLPSVLLRKIEFVYFLFISKHVETEALLVVRN